MVVMLVLAIFSIVVVMTVPHGSFCRRNDLTLSTRNKEVRGSKCSSLGARSVTRRGHGQGTLIQPGDAGNQG